MYKNQDLQNFKDISVREFNNFAENVDEKALAKAAKLINDSMAKGGRLHITGIGKPGHIAGYAASLISSTGTPAYFLHGTEAVHGSCGQLKKGDVVIAISNSGNTSELITTCNAILNNGCKIIAVTGGKESQLAKLANVTLYAGIGEEGGPLNRAPRASIIAETYILQCLSIMLQSGRDLTPQQYVKWHPGGTLGKLRKNEVK